MFGFVAAGVSLLKAATQIVASNPAIVDAKNSGRYVDGCPCAAICEAWQDFLDKASD